MKLGIIFRWGSFWIGVHWSAHNRRLCVNLIPFVTMWVTLFGGTPPGKDTRHPMQPFVLDGEIIRFKKNAIVRLVLDNGLYSLNDIACIPFSQEDREQFAQLIGYSLCGFCELSYVSDETRARAEAQEKPK